MPLVTVIIPIYKVEKYIKRCLDSVLNQTIGDWEAICVDDGTPDNSAKIAEEYAAKDSRFKIIHKENGGLSSARNAALEYVNGKYLYYLDSDDFIHPQTFEICTSIFERDGSDMVAFTYHRSYRTTHIIRHILGIPDAKEVKYHRYDIASIEYRVTDDIYQYSTEYSKPKDIESKWAVKHCQVWRVMLRSDIAVKIRFIEGTLYEDIAWWGKVLLQTERATIINLPLYYYYPNPKSILFSENQNRKIDGIKSNLEELDMVYGDASEYKQKMWKERFKRPFLDKLNKKERKLKR